MDKKQAVQIPPDLHRKLKLLALKKSTTIKALVAEALGALVTK